MLKELPCTCGCTTTAIRTVRYMFDYACGPEYDFIDEHVCTNCGEEIKIVFEEDLDDDLPF